MPMPVSIPQDPSSPLRIFLSVRGRVSRRTFWLYGVLALLGLGLLGHALLGIAGVEQGSIEVIVNLLLVWPAVAISAKRSTASATPLRSDRLGAATLQSAFSTAL